MRKEKLLSCKSSTVNMSSLLGTVDVDHKVVGVGHDQVSVSHDIINRDPYLIGGKSDDSLTAGDGFRGVLGSDADDLRVAGDKSDRHPNPPIGWKQVTSQAEWEFVPLEDPEVRARTGCDFALRHKTLPYDPTREWRIVPSTDFMPDGTPFAKGGVESGNIRE